MAVSKDLLLEMVVGFVTVSEAFHVIYYLPDGSICSSTCFFAKLVPLVLGFGFELFDFFHRFERLIPQSFRELFAGVKVSVASLGGDGES